MEKHKANKLHLIALNRLSKENYLSLSPEELYKLEHLKADLQTAYDKYMNFQTDINIDRHAQRQGVSNTPKKNSILMETLEKAKSKNKH